MQNPTPTVATMAGQTQAMQVMANAVGDYLVEKLLPEALEILNSHTMSFKQKEAAIKKLLYKFADKFIEIYGMDRNMHPPLKLDNMFEDLGLERHGSYNSTTGEIKINTNKFNAISGGSYVHLVQTLTTLAHELLHRFQFEQIEKLRDGTIASENIGYALLMYASLDMAYTAIQKESLTGKKSNTFTERSIMSLKPGQRLKIGLNKCFPR
jgi:hypothetical protein